MQSLKLLTGNFNAKKNKTQKPGKRDRNKRETAEQQSTIKKQNKKKETIKNIKHEIKLMCQRSFGSQIL